MDIGTAKLPPGERRGIPHHQLDVLDVTDEASVAAYQAASRGDIADILRRGTRPVVVGGSGLYVRAALDVLDIPPTDPAVRARLEAEADALGVEVMAGRLRALDPVAMQQIQPNNLRRIVRALEVVELTGRPFSATMPRREFVRPTVVLGLRVPRPELDARIEARVRHMWQAGLLDEVRELDALGLRQGRTASRALGYAQCLAQLDGVLDEAQAKEQTATLTRRFARRQESWFNADPRVHWLEASADARAGLLAQALGVVRDNGGHG
jgi:tRNA dimethylallyltransferase